MFKKILKNKKGYTIIETMIAVSLFVVIVIIGMGALLNANLLHRKSQNMLSIIDNLNFIMEDMSRNLRTGYNYECMVPSNGYCSGVIFESTKGDVSDPSDQWIYAIINGKAYRSTDGGSSTIQLTPDEIVLDPASAFVIVGAEPPPGDSRQPFITIKLVGKITFKNVVTPFSLQTSVSQRQIDI
ncbi:MAG: hypothetical protein ABIG99_00515 [Patescibacteria group bacterium]